MNLLRFIAATMALALMATAARAGVFDTSVDVSPILQWGVGFAGAVLTILSGVLLNSIRAYMDKKFALKDSELADSMQNQLDAALKKGIAFAESKLDKTAKGVGKIDVGNVFVATAGKYVTDHWPDLIAKAKITPGGVTDLIIRAMPSETSRDVDSITIAKAGGQPVVEVPPSAAKVGQGKT